jgi:tetratricopeptide (TPR) repeat protein
VQSYAKVRGDPAFELRAQFATLQCDFELLQTDGQHAPSERREALREAIAAGVRRFDQQAAGFDKRTVTSQQLPLNQMRAKVAIMKAVYLSLQPEPNDQGVIDALAGFDTRYPDQNDLLPEVVRLRLLAFQHAGRFADAEAEVKARGHILLASAGAPAIEELAGGFIREGARRTAKGDAAANRAAQQVALRLYEQLLSDSDRSSKTELTVGHLYENAGEWQKAAAIYTKILQGNANSQAAMRGLARTAEAEKRPADAIGYWQQLGKTVRPGDAPWYEATYQVARLTEVMGRKKDACDQLEQLKPAMPGLNDAELRKKLDELYQQACR